MAYLLSLSSSGVVGEKWEGQALFPAEESLASSWIAPCTFMKAKLCLETALGPALPPKSQKGQIWPKARLGRNSIGQKEAVGGAGRFVSHIQSLILDQSHPCSQA